MVDHVRTLLLNPDGVPAYRQVRDKPADDALALFGITGSGSAAAAAVDLVLPLAMAPDLSVFRTCFDQRVTPSAPSSVYTQTADALSPTGLYGKVLQADGWWTVSALFHADRPDALAVLTGLRAAACSQDAPYALGAVLLACAYRRHILQDGGTGA